MARDRLATRVDVLVELAQSGGAAQALAEADRELADSAGRGAPGLHYARAVALHALGDHRSAAVAAGVGAAAAAESGRDGWRAALLAMRAVQLLEVGQVQRGRVLDLVDPSTAYDEGTVVRDLAEAQAAMARGVPDVTERTVAYETLAEAYTRLRLYELAVPMHLSSYRSGDAGQVAPEVPGVQQLNLSTLHLTWASELVRVGLDAEAGEHCRQAGVHARAAEQLAAGQHAQSWAERARLFAACAAAQGPDPLAAVAAADRSLAALEPLGAAFERGLTAPFLALALLRGGRSLEALARIETALAELGPGTDPLVTAATRHAHLVLLVETDPGAVAAAAGLAYGEALSVALWRQRARRLSAAEEVLRYERLRLEHEEVSRTSDVDVLTGAATRRGFDRRVAQLEARRREQDAVVCVLVIDVDGLKQINDGYGHPAGDAALRAIGQALIGCTRDGDLVGRYGGDEFVALLSAEAGSGRVVADRMLLAVRALGGQPGLPERVSVSVGVALTAAGRGLDDTLAAADRAMYVAKRAGGDAVVAEP